MEKLNNLTQEQVQVMYETRDEWINLFFDNVNKQKGIDKQMFEKGIKWLYEELLKKPTPKVIYCDSWLSCLLTIGIMESGASVWDSVRDSVWDSVRASVGASVGASVEDSVWASVEDSVGASVRASVGASVEDSVRDSVGASVRDSVGASVRDSVGASVWDSVRDSVGASVGASVGDSVRASVGASVRASVRDSVGASVWDSVWDSVRASVGASVEDSVRDSVGASVRDSVGASVEASVGASVGEYSTYLDLSNYGWVSFYDFFEKIGVLDNFNFKQYKNLLKSGVFNAYEYENYVFAIQPPIYVERNAQGRLHSTKTMAVKFRDGSGYYYINGRSVPEWVIESPEKITKEAFLTEQNAEIKGAMYEVLGQAGIASLLGTEIIDTQEIRHANGDTEIVELLRTSDTFQEIDNNPFVWVKVTCPSTGTNYMLGVEPHHTDALEALASLSPFDKNDYKLNYRS